MKIVTFLNHKGGVSKTVSCIHLSFYITKIKKGSRVLLVDLDHQMNLTDFFVEEKTPPLLSDLFPDRINGPHQEFVSEEACLSCHQSSISIPNIGITPKIAHEFRKNCTTCHLLPKMQI